MTDQTRLPPVNRDGLKIIIDAQISPDGSAGGVQQFVTCLLWGLGRLTDSSERYVVVGPYKNPEWLRPYLGENQVLVRGPSPRRLKWLRARLRPLRRKVRAVLGDREDPPPLVPTSDGFFESLGGEVLHFPYQGFFRTDIATVYNPHDLQHLHYPEFFTEDQIVSREVGYRAGCQESRAVVTESRWVKEDIIKNYGIDPAKVHAVPWGPPTVVYPEVTDKELTRVRNELNLPEMFAFYPAQTWPHKNHLRLMEALRGLSEEQDLKLSVICTGRLNWHWPVIEQRRRELGLEDRVRFLGYVDELHLRALYRLCTFVIIPSLFEGGGFPVLEGFAEGAPVAAAAVTSLPEYAGDAALLFDPLSIEAIQDALWRMSTDEALRTKLKTSGETRIARFDWERTARTYRAIYRQVAGADLSPEDEQLLEGDGSS